MLGLLFSKWCLCKMPEHVTTIYLSKGKFRWQHLRIFPPFGKNFSKIQTTPLATQRTLKVFSQNTKDTEISVPEEGAKTTCPYTLTHTQTHMHTIQTPLWASLGMNHPGSDVVNDDQCFRVCSDSALTATWDWIGWEAAFSWVIAKFSSFPRFFLWLLTQWKTPSFSNGQIQLDF